jgi:hypothetical protein
LSLVLRPTDAKKERLIERCLAGGGRANREFGPWMRLIVGKIRPRLGQPFHIPGGKLRTVRAPTLVILAERDGLIGSATAAANR